MCNLVALFQKWELSTTDFVKNSGEQMNITTIGKYTVKNPDTCNTKKDNIKLQPKYL